MNALLNDEAIKFLSSRRLPGRLNPEQAAAVLGFQKHDIPILVAKKLLKPLGKPTHSSIKWFAARDVEQLAGDTAWLGKATQGVSEYWRGRNERGGSIRAPLQEWEVQG